MKLRVVCKDGKTQVFHGNEDISNCITGINISIHAGMPLIEGRIFAMADLDIDTEVNARVEKPDADVSC